MAKYKWDDGKGKVHTRPEGKKHRTGHTRPGKPQGTKAPGKPGARPPKAGKPGASKKRGTPEFKRRQARLEAKPYKEALRTALQTLAPQLTQGKQQAQNWQEHAQEGGGIDQAFDRTAEFVGDAAKQNRAMGRQTQQRVDMGTNLAGNAVGQAALASVPGMAQELQAMGQSSKAAEVAAADAGSAQAMLAQRGAITGDTQEAKASFMGGHLASLQGALGVRRAEMGQAAMAQAGQAQAQVAAIQSQARSQAKGALAEGQQQAFANQLAMQSLGLKAADLRLDAKELRVESREKSRDRKHESRQERRKDQRQARREEAADERQARSDLRIEEVKARIKAGAVTPKDLAMYDVNKNGRLDPGEAVKQDGGAVGPDGVPKGKAKFHAGRNGKAIVVNEGDYRKYKQSRDKIVNDRDTIITEMRSGKHSSNAKETIRRKIGFKAGWKYDMAYDIAVRKQRGEKYHIPRKYLPLLKSEFPQGLPADINRALSPR